MFTSGEAPDDVVEKYLLGLLRTATQGGNTNAPPDPGHVGESAERMRVMLFKVAETIGNDSEYFASDRMLVRLGLSLVAMIKRESGPAAQVDIRAAADRAVTNALQTAQRRTEPTKVDGQPREEPGPEGNAEALAPADDVATRQYVLLLTQMFLPAVRHIVADVTLAPRDLPEVEKRIRRLVSEESARVEAMGAGHAIESFTVQQVLRTLHSRGFRGPDLVAKAEYLLGRATSGAEPG